MFITEELTFVNHRTRSSVKARNALGTILEAPLPGGDGKYRVKVILRDGSFRLGRLGPQLFTVVQSQAAIKPVNPTGLIHRSVDPHQLDNAVQQWAQAVHQNHGPHQLDNAVQQWAQSVHQMTVS